MCAFILRSSILNLFWVCSKINLLFYLSFFRSKLPDRVSALNLKFLVKYVLFILLILPIMVLWNLMSVNKYFVNKKITASFPTKMDPKYYIKCYKLQIKNFWKHWVTSFQNLQFMYITMSFSSLSILVFFAFTLLFIPTFNDMSDYFFVWSNWVAVTTVWICINFETELF